MSERICSVDDCDRPVTARGWCGMHYQRWKTHGDPLKTLRRKNFCSVEDCDGDAFSRGWCQKHYSRVRNHGHPGDRPVAKRPIIDGRRECSKCGVLQPLENYSKSSSHLFGLNPWCRKCRSDSRKALYARDPERYAEAARWKTVKWKYGITREQYDKWHAAQGGCCAICGAAQKRLAIDHDHACCPGGKTCGACLRDLLCTSCNSLLGLANDDPDRLLAAVAYLRRWVRRL